VLIGKSGVGKTAIVEGLALRIAEGVVPPGLQDKRLVSLDLATMLAGARIRGEYEERLKSALALIAAAKGEFVLLIDELHMIVGTGGGDGGMDVSNMLKPMLARGEMRLIGASTPDEYRRHVERDAALERLFQPVHVEAPSLRDTVQILRGLRERREAYHGVRIGDSAGEAAVALSDRCVSGRQLPDKAVDLIDEAASRLRIGIECPPSGLDRVTRAALLQVLDDGRLTDGHGRTVDFTNTVLIMTSNLREDPKDFFRPEFINRIDEIVRFRSLTPADLSEIVRIQLRHLAARAEGVGITLDVDSTAEAWLAARGYDPDYGARPLRRVIQREVSDRLAVLLLDGTFNAGDTIHIGVADDQLSFH
jgi:ATP-dependent Clp protease ATP-binding subunit ClpA